MVQTAAHPGGGWEGLASMPPYIYVHFSPKNFLSCQNRSERGGLNGLPDGRPAEPLPRSSLWSACPPSQARRLVGVRGRSPRPLSSPGWPLPRPRARTPARARSVRGSPVLLLLNPSPFRTRPHAHAYVGRTCARGLKPGIFIFPSTSKCRGGEENYGRTVDWVLRIWGRV